MSDPAAETERVVCSLLAAIESRDLRALADVLAPDCTWQNVPHPPTAGRGNVVALLAPVVCWSDRVEWEVLSESYGDGIAWVERFDRFWIDGSEHVVRCNGVIRVDPSTVRVASVRDYVDLGEWRERIGSTLQQMAARSAVDVVARHLRAVCDRDPVAMAADYALDAVLDRGPTRHSGWFEIADYFDTVPTRLGSGRLDLGAPVAVGLDAVDVEWSIHDGDGLTIVGNDRYRVAGGRIVEQQVTLAGGDF